jgi:predicted DNA-binding transcriptional regulator AlpA
MARGQQAARDFERAKRPAIDDVKPRAAKAEISKATVEEAPIRARQDPRSAGDRLLDRRAIEARTSLDITTIYRRIKVGAFPPPVRVARRRVAWRESDVAAWQDGLEVGVRKV